MPWQCGMMLRFQFNNRVALSSCNRPLYLSTDVPKAKASALKNSVLSGNVYKILRHKWRYLVCIFLYAVCVNTGKAFDLSLFETFLKFIDSEADSDV